MTEIKTIWVNNLTEIRFDDKRMSYCVNEGEILYVSVNKQRGLYLASGTRKKLYKIENKDQMTQSKKLLICKSDLEQVEIYGSTQCNEYKRANEFLGYQIEDLQDAKNDLFKRIELFENTLQEVKM